MNTRTIVGISAAVSIGIRGLEWVGTTLYRGIKAKRNDVVVVTEDAAAAKAKTADATPDNDKTPEN